jgi:hypothetical protein
MKRFSILAAAYLLGSLAATGLAQSTPAPAPVKGDATTQTKPDKKVAKERARADKGSANAQSGKKTITSQDAAYALVYKQSAPKSDPK